MEHTVLFQGRMELWQVKIFKNIRFMDNSDEELTLGRLLFLIFERKLQMSEQKQNEADTDRLETGTVAGSEQ